MIENEEQIKKLQTSLMGYNKQQTEFELSRLNERIKILEGDVNYLKNKDKSNKPILKK